MSTLYRISLVGLHLLLLTHVAQSFVLLTANVEDVKKIARKFVSDSLAERITDFIARATKTLAEDKKMSEEIKAKDSSQVSAENRMYNRKVEKTINDRLDDIIKTQEAMKVNPKSSSTEKESHKEVELTTSKPKKALPKPLHGRSRYIEQEKTVETTEKSTTATNVEDNIKNLKESIKNIEEINISSTPTVTKAKTKRRYKLLSAYDDKTTAAAGIPDDKAKTDGKRSPHPKRSMGEEKAAETDNDSYDTNNKYVTEKAVSEYDQYDIKRNKNTESEGASAPMSEKDEYDIDINNIIPKDEKAKTRGSLVKEKDFNDDKWWEKELPTNKQSDVDVHGEGKAWF